MKLTLVIYLEDIRAADSDGTAGSVCQEELVFT